jgi:hypothetical protein
LSLSDFKPALPCSELALVSLLPTALLHNTLRRSVIIEWEIKVDVKMIPDGLPHPSPVERVDIVGALRTTLLTASTAIPSLGSSRAGRDLRRRADRTLRFALRTIPCASGYFIQTDTVCMGRGIASVAQKENILIISFAAYRTRLEISEVIFRVFNDH